MAFNPGVTEIQLDTAPQVINVPQRNALSPDPDGLDQVPTLIQADEIDTSVLDVGIAANGSVTVLPGGSFSATDPGEYELELVAVDAFGAVLASKLQTIRVAKTFRRYVVPDGCLVLDLDKPFDTEVDEFGFPTGKAIVHLQNNTEWLRAEILHPENDELLRSSVDFDISWPASSYCEYDNSEPQVMWCKFTVPDDDNSWQSVTYNGTTYEYQDFVIPKFSIKFLAVEDKRLLSPIGGGIVCRVWKQYLASAVPVRMAPVDDNTLYDMLAQASKGLTFSGTVRTRGYAGTATGMPDGYRINAVAGPTQYTNFTFTSWDEYTSSNFGAAPRTNPQIQMIQNRTFSLSVNSAIDGTKTRRGYNPQNPYNKAPAPAYNWMVLDLTTRFSLVVLPLCINPVDVPVSPGYYSVVPLQFFIHDKAHPGQATDCTAAITFEFPSVDSRFKFVQQTGGGIDWDVEATSKRTFESSSGNPLECSKVYTIWLYIPDEATHPAESLLINGEEFVTFTLTAMDFNPDMADRDLLFGLVNAYVALGNYSYMMNPETTTATAMHRVCQIWQNMQTFMMGLGNMENIRHGGYQFADSTAAGFTQAYLLAQSNWVGCIQEDWITKAQEFLDARDWAGVHFLDFLLSPTAFASATNGGLNLGLPMGAATAYFNAAPGFNVDRWKVSIILIINFFTGFAQTETYIMDWDGNWRVIADRLYAPVRRDDMPANKPEGGTWTLAEWQQELEDHGPVGLWIHRIMEARNGPLYAWDVYWIDFAINTRQYSGLRVDGFNEQPFLLNPNHMRAYDPTSNTYDSVVDSRDFSHVGSYEDNATLPLNSTDYAPDQLTVVSSVQVYIADDKYTGGGRYDTNGNPLDGLQKIQWERQFSWDFRPL